MSAPWFPDPVIALGHPFGRYVKGVFFDGDIHRQGFVRWWKRRLGFRIESFRVWCWRPRNQVPMFRVVMVLVHLHAGRLVGQVNVLGMGFLPPVTLPGSVGKVDRVVTNFLVQPRIVPVPGVTRSLGRFLVEVGDGFLESGLGFLSENGACFALGRGDAEPFGDAKGV